MMAYCFRLKFRVGKTIDLPDESALLNVPGLVHAATITSNKPRLPGVDQWLAIKSCGYSSEEEAWAAALRLKEVFLIAGADGMGADFGTDQVRSRMSDEIKRKMREEHNVIIRDEVHGVDVFEDGPVQHFMFSAQASVQ